MLRKSNESLFPSSLALFLFSIAPPPSPFPSHCASLSTSFSGKWKCALACWKRSSHSYKQKTSNWDRSVFYRRIVSPVFCCRLPFLLSVKSIHCFVFSWCSSRFPFRVCKPFPSARICPTCPLLPHSRLQRENTFYLTATWIVWFRLDQRSDVHRWSAILLLLVSSFREARNHARSANVSSF